MAQRLLIGAAILFAFSCTSHRTVSDGGLDPYRGRVGTGMLHLHCTYTAPYCGGAAPDPSDYPRAYPWRGRMFIRAAHPDSTGKFSINDLREPVLDTITTNAEGHGFLALPAGTYLMLDQDRVDGTQYEKLLHDHAKPAMYTEPIDTACLRRWLHGPFGVLTIAGGDTLHMEYPMYGQCPWYSTPCVHYFGPLPP